MEQWAEKRRTVLWAGAALILLAAILAVALRITTVTVSGSTRYSPQQMEDYLFQDTWDRNFLVCYLKDHFKPHRQIPFVEDYRLVFHGPFHVEVIVYEKSVVGYVSCMSSYMYFDKDGTIVEVSDTKTQGIPQVTGIEFDHVILYEPLPVENQKVFQDILSITQLLTKYDIAAEKIYFNESFEMTLYFGNARVRLGSGDNIEEKIMRLKTILPDIEGKSGVLHLENYQQGDENITFQLDKDSVSGN